MTREATEAGGQQARAGDRVGVLVERLAGPEPPPFAALHRPETARPGQVDVLIGDVVTVPRLADLPQPDLPAEGRSVHDLVVLVPYRQLAERGMQCRDDGTPLQAIRVREHVTVDAAELVHRLPAEPTPLRDAHFDIGDDEYTALVRAVVSAEIGCGEGANFVVKRSFLATIEDYSTRKALAVFGRLLTAERGAHWTFCVHTGDRTLIGASPERHITIEAGVTRMNPISGTYRYPAGGATVAGVLEFLADQKESDELYMVLDEELKMMGRVCAAGGRVTGPWLRPMARLAHTEYVIEGTATADTREVLRRTMFAPTVTGSPLANACRVIIRYEPTGRAYYSGVLALIGRDAAGRQSLDSTIIIRTADIDRVGRLRLDLGATLVRHSRPESEAAETRAKAATLLGALGFTSGGRPEPPGALPDPAVLASDGDVRRVLGLRNDTLSRFWLGRPGAVHPVSALAGRTALVIDCDDDFTSMLAHQLRWLGLRVTVRPHDDQLDTDRHHLVVLGPGPGDPRDLTDPKIATMHRVCRRVLADRTPLLAVCLGHQVLAGALGLDLVRRAVPHQGVQREIDYFGRRERCGFYNSFAVRSAARIPVPIRGGWAEVARDRESGEVHAARGDGLWSLQFHAESVLTENGVEILDEITRSLLGVDRPPRPTADECG